MDRDEKNWKGDVKILLIEDSPTQGEKLKYFLEEGGFKVDWVLSSEEGLALLDKHLPTIIICDVMLPGMDGFEFCRRVKDDDRWKQIPVIILTNLSEPSDILKGLDSGADNFITKPYNRHYLLSRVDYLLVNQRLRTVSSRQNPEMGMEIFFAGKKHYITSERLQIIDLLFSTYEAIVQKNIELERLNKELKEANDKIKTLSGLIPICSRCKKVRNDDGYWQEVEDYVMSRTDVDFTHGICGQCMEALYPDFHNRKKKKTESKQTQK